MGWPRFRTPHPSGNHLPNSLETSHVHICGRRNTHEFKDKFVRLQNYVVSTRGKSLSWWCSCVVHGEFFICLAFCCKAQTRPGKTSVFV